MNMKKKIIFLSIFIFLLAIGGVAAFYFTKANQKPIVYYSHDADYEGLPQVAGCFENYVNSLLKLGLVGDDFYNLEPLTQICRVTF